MNVFFLLSNWNAPCCKLWLLLPFLCYVSASLTRVWLHLLYNTLIQQTTTPDHVSECTTFREKFITQQLYTSNNQLIKFLFAQIINDLPCKKPLPLLCPQTSYISHKNPLILTHTVNSHKNRKVKFHIKNKESWQSRKV